MTALDESSWETHRQVPVYMLDKLIFVFAAVETDLEERALRMHDLDPPSLGWALLSGVLSIP
jgi:hypothetical protein